MQITNSISKKVIFVLLLFIVNNVNAQSYSGGSGTLADPYLIANKTDLLYLSENAGEWSKNFKQTANIVFAATDFQSGGAFYNSGKGFSPIGNDTTKFTGTYDGNNHTIDGLTIIDSTGANTYPNYGMFGYISGSSAKVSNLGLVNVYISLDIYQPFVGSLAGRIDYGTISDCYATGEIKAKGQNVHSGGLVGQPDLNGTILSCYSTVNLNIATRFVNEVGGLIGRCFNSSISNCYATGAVSDSAGNSAANPGGLVGQINNGTTVSNCYAAGAVSSSSPGTFQNIGGLAGWDDATNTYVNCFYDTQTTGQTTPYQGGTDVSGQIEGKTTAQMKTISTFVNAGWDFGGETGNGSNDYWNINTYRNSGYPFLTYQYPVDPVQTIPVGDGTSGNPYQISSLNNLFWLSQNSSVWSSGNYFIQTANIQAGQTTQIVVNDNPNWSPWYGFPPIGNLTNNFQGDYNGQGYVIDSISIQSAPDYLGLFGCVSNASIKNLGLTNGVFISNGTASGGLAGYVTNGSTIDNCYYTGSNTTNSNTGGLIGKADGSNVVISNSYSSVGFINNSNNENIGGFIGLWEGTSNSLIKQCYSSGVITTKYYNIHKCGGFAGYTNSAIENCYSLVRINTLSGGGGSAGGFGGFEDVNATTTNCYSSGSLGVTNNYGFYITANGTNQNCFFNSDSSGVIADSSGSSSGLNGVSILGMLNEATFTAKTWDFQNETINGTADIWGINPTINNGMPFLTMQGFTSYAVAPSGTGDASDPFKIATLQNLYWLSQNKTAWTPMLYFTQTADIDASATSSWNGGKGFLPIASTDGFFGNYDGQNHTIKNLYISFSGNDNIGLFGYLNGSPMAGSSVTNLTLNGSNVSGNNNTGSLAGLIYYNSYIRNCFVVNGNISGKTNTGGLIGSASGVSVNIDSCGVTANIIANTNGSNVGGFIGNWGSGGTSKIQECYTDSTFNISSGADNCGGFVGTSNGRIENCYSSLSITLNGNVAGFAGTAQSGSNIINSYSGSYSNASNFIGFTKTNSGTDTACFYINDYVSSAVGSGDSTGISGLSYIQSTSINNYVSAGWDLKGETINGTKDLWNSNLYRGLLFLTYQYPSDPTQTIPASGDGSSGNPYQIASIENLFWLSQNLAKWDSSEYFIQTADIDASTTSGWFNGAGFLPIGNMDVNEYFSGNYNGQNHTISNLLVGTSKFSHYGGLFGIADGYISNLVLSSVNVSGSSGGGGLTGTLITGGSILKCSVSGNVNSDGPVGGLVGLTNGNNVVITESSSSANVTGNGTYTGGLIGYFDAGGTSFIKNCYSNGSVTASNGAAAGFAGYSNSLIKNSYSSSPVSATGGNPFGFIYENSGGIDTSNFWNNETAGTTTSSNSGNLPGIIPIPTSQMQTQSTFLNEGWDPNIWYMDSGKNNGYPYLAWQNPGGTPLPVELKDFSANINDYRVELKWTTATEINNYGFEIQRAAVSQPSANTAAESRTLNADSWEKIGFVQGNGNSNSPKAYAFTDESVKNGKYEYRLKQIDSDGKFKYSKTIELEVNKIPKEFALKQNYPNPFNPVTSIEYQVPVTSKVIIKVYDLLGNEIATLANEQKTPGSYIVKFNASNLASGVYLYRLQTDNFVQTRKLLLLK